MGNKCLFYVQVVLYSTSNDPERKIRMASAVAWTQINQVLLNHRVKFINTPKSIKLIALGNVSKYRHQVTQMPINWVPIISDSVECLTQCFIIGTEWNGIGIYNGS